MTNEEFFGLIEKKAEQHPLKSKWKQKTEKFFDGFQYFNVDVLVEGHISRLTHVGVNSMALSSKTVQEMTTQTLSMIENQLKSITDDVGSLTSQFEDLHQTLHKRQGFFSNKNSSDLFFEKFKSENEDITKKIRGLNLKEHDLSYVKNVLEDNVEKISECYVLLQKDIDFLNEAEEKLAKHDKYLIQRSYQKAALELTGIKTDLLTHQQILFQKYAGTQILLTNIFNCHRNIKYISQVTHNVLMNIAELQQISSLSKSHLSDKETSSLKKLKETLTLVTTDLRLIAAQPFHTVVSVNDSHNNKMKL